MDRKDRQDIGSAYMGFLEEIAVGRQQAAAAAERILHPRLDDLNKANYLVMTKFYPDGSVAVYVEDADCDGWVYTGSGTAWSGETQKELFLKLIDEAALTLLPSCNS